VEIGAEWRPGLGYWREMEISCFEREALFLQLHLRFVLRDRESE